MENFSPPLMVEWIYRLPQFRSSHPFLLRRLHACYLLHLLHASSFFPLRPFFSSPLPSPSLPIDFLFQFPFSVSFSSFSELMGAAFARYLTEHGASSSSSSSPLKSQFGDLPESCISEIFMFLDPPDVCKLARLNRASRDASFADFVWESKLPSNYKFLVKKFGDQDADYMCKKDVYARLCRPNRFDNGKKEFWLDKGSGKIFLAISSKALKITGIDDRRYWNHIPSEESRFYSVAYLKQIWWVEILGELEFEFPPGSYSVYFRLQLGKTLRRFGRRIAELDQVHGWDIKPVRFQLSASNGQNAITECYLDQFGNWVDYLVGDFTVDNPCTLMKIKFSMIQIDCTHTKGGLCVDSVFIRPKIGGKG